MRWFTLIVFALHTLAETVFGLSLFLSGVSSSQTAAEAAAQSSSLTIAARFQAAGLMGMALLGVLVLFYTGIASQTARIAAFVLAFFHTAGCAGIALTAASDPTVLSTTHAQGALIIHGLLVAGFIAIIAFAPRPAP